MLAELELTPNDARALAMLDPEQGRSMRSRADAGDATHQTPPVWSIDNSGAKRPRSTKRAHVTLLLALGSALGYGLSDFTGGVVTRRTSVWAVAATSQATATLVAALLLAVNAGDPTTADLAWGILAGVGSAGGNLLIYWGLAHGRMSVVAPLSALTSAMLPVIVGLSTGERPGGLPFVGLLLALPAIWLVSASGERLHGATRRDVTTGVLAGLGFGLQFSSLGQVAPSAGLTPLVVSQLVSVIAIVATAALRGATWLPRDRYAQLGSVAGLLAGIATVCFQLAAQQGPLAIAGVVASLYPAVTVLLAAIVLREAVHGRQSAGLALALAAVALIALG